MNLRTGVVVSIDQMKQPAQFIEAKTKLSTSANEVEASQVIDIVDAIAARAAGGDRHHPIFS